MSNVTSSGSNEISLADLAQSAAEFGRDLRRRRGVVLRLMLVGGLVGIFLALGSQSEYSAQIRIVPYRNGGAGGGGLAGLAGLAGFRLPAGAVDQAISADLYPEVVRSLDFRLKVAQTPIFFSSLGRAVSTVEYFDGIRRPSLVESLSRYTVGLPFLLLEAVRETADRAASGGAPTNSATSDSERIASYSRDYLKILEVLQERTSVSLDKKTSVITIAAEMPDPYAAADLVRITADRLMETAIEYESRKAGEHYRFVEIQHRRASERHEAAQEALAAFSDRNRALISRTAMLDRDRLQRESDLAFEVFQQLSRELEQARLKMSQDTPVFAVLEQVTVPAGRSRPKRALLVLGSLVVGALVGVGVVAWGRASRAEAPA